MFLLIPGDVKHVNECCQKIKQREAGVEPLIIAINSKPGGRLAATLLAQPQSNPPFRKK